MAKEVELSNGTKALVDDEDFERVTQWRWQAKKSNVRVYAARTFYARGANVTVRMHRWLLGDIPPGCEVNHINGDTLDNRRCNLQVVTREQHNQQRSRRSARVWWDRRRKRWTITAYLGSYTSREAAEEAAAKWAGQRST